MADAFFPYKKRKNPAFLRVVVRRNYYLISVPSLCYIICNETIKEAIDYV